MQSRCRRRRRPSSRGSSTWSVSRSPLKRYHLPALVSRYVGSVELGFFLSLSPVRRHSPHTLLSCFYLGELYYWFPPRQAPYSKINIILLLFAHVVLYTINPSFLRLSSEKVPILYTL